MAIRVSVVVPVYNPGSYLDPLLDSLARQSLPRDAWEAVFVDDGSTDGSGARLDRFAAATMLNVRVIHIPNSGWPGRPRNVGLEASDGEYAIFTDHDDWLGDEALERLVATADRTGADVVIGREVGHGRGVPRELFRANVDDASLDRDPLLRLMTPHKLVRRSMLDRHAIRFPEGRRRFEDHLFVLRCFFAAQRISILADYPCYHWVTRQGHANASDAYADPRDYYRDLRDVLDVVDENVSPGPARDRMLAHWYRRRCLDRLAGARWTDSPAPHDRDVFDAVRDLAGERIGPGVDAALPLSHRLRSAAVRAGQPELVTGLARAEHGLRARVRLRSIEHADDRLRLQLVADAYDASTRPISFRRHADGRVTWDPPAASVPAGAFGLDQLEASRDLDATVVSIVLRRSDGSLEHAAPTVVERILRYTPTGPVLSIRARADIDLRTVAVGRELDAGDWDLLADVQSCGWRSLRRLGSMAGAPARQPLRLRVARGGASHLAVDGRSRPGPAAPIRRPAGRHALERLVPRAVLRRLPLRVRQSAKRVLLRLGRPVSERATDW